MNLKDFSFLTIVTVVLFLAATLGAAQEKNDSGQTPPVLPGKNDVATTPMTNIRLGELIKRIDENASGRSGFWTFNVNGRQIAVITDENADRMRIISAVVESGEVDQAEHYRLLQANFDTSLDARYAIAKETLWSAFIHPLGSLTDKEFLSGVGQVVNLAESYGKSYSSGLLIFRGGDSGNIERRKLIDRLLKKGLSI